MSEIKRFLVEDNGETHELFVEIPNIPDIPSFSQRPGEMGVTEDILIRMQEVQEQIKIYAKFALGAFVKLAEAEVEEITLKFGVKLNGKAGAIFTEGSAEGSMEVQVKCKPK